MQTSYLGSEKSELPRAYSKRLLDDGKHTICLRINAWWKRTSPSVNPALNFIKTSRDLILKEGRFNAYATHSTSGSGEDDNREITREYYDLAYYEAGTRKDLLVELRNSIDWCDEELRSLEQEVPEVPEPLPTIADGDAR